MIMAAAVIIVYKTAILYETNIQLNYYNILIILYCRCHDNGSGGERWRIDNNIAMVGVVCYFIDGPEGRQ